MSEPSSDRRIFSLDQARALLPRVKALTADAVRDVDALTAELEAGDRDAGTVVHDEDERERLTTERDDVIALWADRMAELGLEAKGAWLVDFDTGSGYYCWRYPEDAVSHFHGYEDGFAGRMKIM